MIFVVLGTWGMPFLRPIIEIENLVKNGDIKEDVIVQAGNTTFFSQYLKIIDFFDKQNFDETFSNASYIITQAGVGSIMNGLKFKKKVIAIARLEKYKEHINDHQLEILSTFSSKGYIIPWDEQDQLKDVIKKIETFEPQSYPFAKGQIAETIIDYLENNCHKNKI